MNVLLYYYFNGLDCLNFPKFNLFIKCFAEAVPTPTIKQYKANFIKTFCCFINQLLLDNFEKFGIKIIKSLFNKSTCCKWKPLPYWQLIFPFQIFK